MSIEDQINDFNQNIGMVEDPRLEGYMPIEYFRVVDSDRTSKRVRDVAIKLEHFYDFNLENSCD